MSWNNLNTLMHPDVVFEYFRRLFPAANWVENIQGANICCSIASGSDYLKLNHLNQALIYMGNFLGFSGDLFTGEGTTGGFLKGLLSPLPFENL